MEEAHQVSHRNSILDRSRLRVDANHIVSQITTVTHIDPEALELQEAIMKRCKKCGELKPEDTTHFNMLPSGSYRGTCKACMRANTKKHYDKNPQRVMDRVAKYNRQKKSAEGFCSDIDAMGIRNQQNDRCLYCGVNLHGGGELDHKTPVSKGGDNWPENMAWACTTCNRDKYNKAAEEFMLFRKLRGYD